MMQWNRKDLLGLQDLSQEEIRLILDTAASFREVLDRPIKKVPSLRGKTVATLFLEPSTRTRVSFELAAKRLSADVTNIAAQGSSLSKGETLKDMARNIEAMKVDVLVMRHSSPGSCEFLARSLKNSVINAGDGAHEHPTQALLDLFTIARKKNIQGLRVSIVGDILHSRVARSCIWGFQKLGAKVMVCGPKTLLPISIEKMNVRATSDLEEAIRDADVINVLRIQLERQEGAFFPSLREYAQQFCITRDRLKNAKKDVLILHPGPLNRGIEIAPDIADSPYSVILDQVTNGVAIRMAVLFLVSQGSLKEEHHETTH